nr:Protein-arginine deiminase type III [Kibdelosporangium sp. MJ126-NF4]CTQ98513.1 Protein-arginine deiminase type III (EC 3.5.3.15) [Kibdelosporangium sp. MJ126-NF4]
MVTALLATPAAAIPLPDLLADTDRDGRLTAADERGEDVWTASRGAIVLPNVDDDQRHCQVSDAELEAVDIAVDRRLAACHDAADSVVNGPADEADLAPMRIAALPGARTARVTVAPAGAARVFVRRDDGFVALTPENDGVLTAADLKHGVNLAVEGRDVVRDRAVWDGVVTVTLEVPGQGADRVQLRVAPLMLQHDLQPATTVFAGKPGDGPGWPAKAQPWPIADGVPGEWPAFSSSLRTATGPQVETRFVQGSPGWWKDMWWQDTFEPATVSMPVRGGEQSMRVMIRSANRWQLADTDGTLRTSLRPAGRQLFRHLRGPGVGVVQEFTEQLLPHEDDSLNSTGNVESLPPYRGFPHGRLLYGATPNRMPNQAFVRLLTGQGQQPPVVIDTSWLLVGHADETLHVVPAPGERGWTLMVADPRMAEGMLRKIADQGMGGTRLFENTQSPQRPTVAELLADEKFLRGNEDAARHIDRQLSVLLAETGIAAEELVRVPVLWAVDGVSEAGDPLYSAFSPSIPNGLSVTPERFAAPDPHGPVVNGRDVFRDVTEKALRRNGVTVSWVEDFFWAHLGKGEVHCATNAWRDTGDRRWWDKQL